MIGNTVATPSANPAPPATAPRSLRLRHARVLWFFGTTIAAIFFWDVALRWIGLRALSRRTAVGRFRRAAQGFRRLAARLGGVWIKVGQFLSARVDVLPEAVTAELAALQDEVNPERLEVMRSVLEGELGAPLERHYDWFDRDPLASASLGQVHRARMKSGEAVVVKIQRPGIDDLIRVDLAALATVVSWLKRYRPIRRRADLDALLAEFSRTLWEEVDYLAEAENARRFAAMFADDREVRIPAVFASHTTRRVLTLEDVYFIKITDYAAVEAAGVSRAEAADRLFQTYLRQIFLEGFFHADPHPGNLFVEPLEGRWRLVFVDFGMVGRLTSELKNGLRDLAIALGARDVERLLHAYQGMGILLPGADLERILQAETAVFDRFWGKSMRDLVRTKPEEMHRFAHEFRDLMYEMPFQIPRDLIFLGRCVAILSGMCTGLNPDFNLFEGLAPFARRLLAEEGGEWIDRVLDWLLGEGRRLASLPARLDSVLTRLEKGDLVVTAKAAPGLERRFLALERSVNRLVASVVFASLLLAGTALILNGERVLGLAAMGLAVLTLVLVLARFR
jgi:predicted unusual protein kinase regulating ubiquinone biosynthesis (AarF/ABC1/UbiB family)